jgi:hypothetical protein
VSQSARNLAFLLALAAIVGLLAYGLSRRETGPRDLLASAPERAMLLAELDVPALRASSLFLELVGESDAGLDRIREACGFDPLDSFRTVQVFVLRAPEPGGDDEEEALDEVAFVARGDLDHEALARCVGEVVSGDGGGVHRTILEGADAIASDHGTSVAAFLGRDGVVAGADVVVAELLRIQAGASPAMARDDRLERLLRRVGRVGREGAEERAHVRAVARLPRQWQRFLGRLGELAAEDVPLDRARALGLGASLADGVSVSLAIDLDSADAASDAQHAIERRITDARRDPELAASALAVTLAHLDVDAAGGDLVLRATLDRPELDATVALVRRYLAAERARDE